MAIPLRGAAHARRRRGRTAAGARRRAAHDRDLTWLVTVFGQKIEQIRGRGSVAQEARKLRRERTLFYTIINSVTDPILLTDTEGRLIVANARAEKLFAAAEEANEGRRRAVELNNMLFSAALSRTVVEAPSEARELLLVDPGDGSDLLFEVLSSTVEDPREGTGIVSVLRNITDLRRATEQIEENYQKLRIAEAAVRAERDRLNLIIDSVADPIIVTDPGGATVLMNAPAEELFTAPPDAAAVVLRGVQSNDAHFSSFISGLLLGESGPGEIRRGEIALMNPLSGDADSGRSHRRQGAERVGRAHRRGDDSSRPPRGARARAPVRAAQDRRRRTADARPGGHRRAGDPERTAAPPGDRAGTGLTPEVAVPRQHVARVQDAAERHPRLHAHAAAGRGRASCRRTSSGSSSASTRTAGIC